MLAEPIAEEKADVQMVVPTNAFDVNTPSESRVGYLSDSKEPKEDENSSFAWHVVDSFRKAKEPLTQASHMDLNALARAYGILGDVSKCLETLTLVIKRHEVPDIHDINVVIAAMAKRHPIRAAQAVEEMLARGVKPDAVTFGTIVHEALSDGNTELVGHMIELAQSIGIKKLTPQSIASIMQASVTAVPVEDENGSEGPQVQDVNGETIKGYLERAYELVMSGVHKEYLQSAKMGSTCISAALQADEAVLAFKFWKATLRGRVDWDSGRQKLVRRLLVKKIREQCRQGRIDVTEANGMVWELGECLESARKWGREGEGNLCL